MLADVPTRSEHSGRKVFFAKDIALRDRLESSSGGRKNRAFRAQEMQRIS
jgi:hypothetical protein